jgi:hypothetical protein
MDPLRELRPLIQSDRSYRQYLPGPGCGNPPAKPACILRAFTTLVDQRMRQWPGDH